MYELFYSNALKISFEWNDCFIRIKYKIHSNEFYILIIWYINIYIFYCLLWEIIYRKQVDLSWNEVMPKFYIYQCICYILGYMNENKSMLTMQITYSSQYYTLSHYCLNKFYQGKSNILKISKRLRDSTLPEKEKRLIGIIH